MDFSLKNKAALRSLMKSATQKRDEKRIDSPLVRYNDAGKPVCKVCTVSIQGEALWGAHLASRAHKEAVERLKARAKGGASAVARSAAAMPPPSTSSARPASALPSNFFDAPSAKQARPSAAPPSSTGAVRTPTASAIPEEAMSSPALPSAEGSSVNSAVVRVNGSKPDRAPPAGTSALPEGFFDNKSLDQKVRGVEPPKLDMQEELKEYQKLVQEDLQEAEAMQEEEGAAAADDREEREQITQRTFAERIKLLRKKEETVLAARAAAAAAKKVKQATELEGGEEEEEDDDVEEDDGMLLDWRAKRL